MHSSGSMVRGHSAPPSSTAPTCPQWSPGTTFWKRTEPVPPPTIATSAASPSTSIGPVSEPPSSGSPRRAAATTYPPATSRQTPTSNARTSPRDGPERGRFGAGAGRLTASGRVRRFGRFGSRCAWLDTGGRVLSGCERNAGQDHGGDQARHEDPDGHVDALPCPE